MFARKKLRKEKPSLSVETAKWTAKLILAAKVKGGLNDHVNCVPWMNTAQNTH